VKIVAEVSGRLRDLFVDEGDNVQAGQVVATIDSSLLETQIAQAEANLDAARAQLASITAPPRPEEIRAAQAALSQALAARNGAEQAWKDAMAERDTPQDLLVKIDAARAAVRTAAHKVTLAQANLQAAEIQRDRAAKGATGSDQQKAQYQAALAQVEAARAAVQAAQAEQEKAQRVLDNLISMRNNPLALKAKVDAARAQYETSQANVAIAQARLDALLAGATPEDIAIAQANVQQAEAAVDVLRVQMEKYILRSPISGLVTARLAHVGEMAQPGLALLTVTDIDTVRLTVYIPAKDIGQIYIGQPADIRVDAYPGETFVGRLVFIGPQAEFTPRNIQTQKDRANQVFPVKILLPNPGHKLKPGMPADASIRIGARP